MRLAARMILIAFCLIGGGTILAQSEAEPSATVDGRETATEIPASSSGGVMVQKGMLIRVEFDETIGSQLSRTGDIVSYKVVNDVVINDVVVIPAGSDALGRVANASPAKGWGKGGKLEVTVDTVRAIDGTFIPLAATWEEGKGWAAGKTIVGVAALGLLAGGGMKGKKVTINKGHQIDVFIAEDTALFTKGGAPATGAPGVSIDESRVAKACYKICDEKTGYDFIDCMTLCTKLGDVCKGLPSDAEFYECMGKANPQAHSAPPE